jgi:predicted DNA-binding antitoxin AbrB/MazE fold protein
MSAVAEAVYEGGTLKLSQPLPLPEGTRVRLIIAAAEENCDPLAAVIGTCDGPADGAENHGKSIYGKSRA